jgi:hypothetical protein
LISASALTVDIFPQGSLVLSFFDVPADNSHPLAGKTLICVWNSLFPATVAHILACDGVITCACFSSNSTFVVAGSSVGDVLVFNLSDSPTSSAGQVTVLHFDTIRKVIAQLFLFS